MSSASESTAGDVLGSLIRASALPGSVPQENRSDADVGLLRQRIIVNLLLQLPMAPAKLYATCSQLLQCGALTKDVLSELISLGRKSVPRLTDDVVSDVVAGVGLPAAGSVAANAPAPSPVVAPVPAAQALSRFEQDFERLELLGRGAFGSVWRCRHRLDGQEYAVKMVEYRANSSNAAEVERRVLREVQTLASVNHANVARYHNAWVEVDWEHLASAPEQPQLQRLPSVEEMEPSIYGLTDFEESEDGVEFVGSEVEEVVHGIVSEPESPDGEDLGVVALQPNKHGRSAGSLGVSYKAKLYIQTELCSKDTLLSWISQRNAAVQSGVTKKELKAWATQAATIFHEVVSVLAKLHEHNIAHRDIKPSNILFAPDGSVRLGDFGLAKVLDGALALEDHAAAGKPGGSTGVGTPSYASPEQLASASYDVKTDVHALGMVLAELLCPVATHMERAALFEGLRQGKGLPKDIEAAFPSCARLVTAMTSPDVNQRPSAKQLLEAHEQIMMEVHTRLSMQQAARTPHAKTADTSVVEPSDRDCNLQVQVRGRTMCRRWRGRRSQATTY